MENACICTIVSKNYISLARTLTESFLKHHSDSKVFVLLVDRLDGYFAPADEKFELIEIEQLKDQIPNFEKFLFQYHIVELNTAVKPYFLEYLFTKYGFSKIFYLDPDMYVANRLDELSNLLDEYSVVLTPHLTAPIEDSLHPDETEILKAGAYNLGFMGLARTTETEKVLKWWQKRLYKQCRFPAVVEGENPYLFVDQKWIDLVPGMFNGVYILREPGYNFAYWNYHCRYATLKDSEIFINEKPAYLLHFSGVDPENYENISKYQRRYTLKEREDLRPLFEMYSELVLKNGYSVARKWPYAFDSFDNGARIPGFAKRLMNNMSDDEAVKFGDPFKTGEMSYFDYLCEPVDRKEPVIPRIVRLILQKRPDFQRDFPEALTDNRLECREAIRRQYGIHDLFFERAQQILDAKKKHRQVDFRDDGVNLAGYLAAELGVGEAARGNVRALEAAGIPYALNNISTHSSSRENDASFTVFSNDNPYSVNLVHVNADMTELFRRERGPVYFDGKYNIGYWYWELAEFPQEWLSAFKLYDEIWVASSFVQDAISKVSPIPVVRIPACVTLNKIKDVGRDYFGIDRECFVFLIVFDYLSFMERKNPLAAIEAFKLAFGSKEDVTLVIKSSNGSQRPEARQKILDAVKDLRVRLIEEYLDKDELHALMNLSDCYVSLHRSEGFGLPLAESMLLGKPVIATAYSGNMTFMDNSNSLLVNYKLTELKEDYGPYKKGSLWAEPDIEHAAKQMRLVVEDPRQGIELGQVASKHIIKNLSSQAVGRQIKSRLELIYQRS